MENSSSTDAANPSDCLCQNGGVCVDLNGTCECPRGFTGLYCQFEVTQTPCSNSRPCPDGGPCLEYGGTYLCTCQTGVDFDRKDFYPYVQPQSACDSSPCQNGGYCYEKDGGYNCECKHGYRGKRCEIVRLSFCASSPCRYGGSCEEEGDSYRCLCPHRFTGKYCEVGRPDPCASSPCLNGGTCFHYIGKYKCECFPSFIGRHCDINRGSDPALKGLDCGSPVKIKHAEVQYSSTTLGSIASYTCHPGYTALPRATQSTCSSQGFWSQPPVCEDLLPPSGLHVLRVEEKEVELRWDQSDATQNLISGFAIVFAPVGRLPRRTDFLEKQHSTYVLQGLNPGQLYNISAFSVKRNTNSNDISQPAFALIRTRPRKVEQLEVVNVSSSQVWLRWLVLVNRHTAVSQVRVSLVPADGGRPRTAILNSNVSEYTFSTLLPGQMYTIDVVTQSGLRPEDLPSTSKSAGPLHFWTRPLPPQNLSLSSITATSARVTWDHHPQSLPDGFVVNITQGLTTRSRYLPDGSLGTYTLRDLAPGQHCHLALTSVHKTGKDKIESVPQHLAFTTLPILKDQSRGDRLQGGQNYRVGQIWTQVKDGGTVDNTEPFEDPLRYTEFIDGRGRITAKFTSLPHKTIRHRTKPDPPIRLEKLDKTTNKISLALEIPEEVTKNKSESSQDCRAQTCQNGGTCVQMNELYSCNCATDFKGRWCELYCQRWSHPCTRLYSETKSVPVWEDGVCHYLYKRTYKVQQDVCFREICEPLLPTKTPTIDMYLPSTPSGIFL
ncbi:sushi, nidogen and EGF-like domain-containing protein 1 isoform X13 [Triplophysa rosa]|uniref:sushi, nidogen and EGF-like domain-containing protein 1 isoform X13 n=1 Tax=Triplophysa rosa TaxID=992332 RepID=UPI002545CED9|nr:sushi, nidogen and EGF-like domain-containing protein 1 isoform X13 [Triplophysa rosa]